MPEYNSEIKKLEEELSKTKYNKKTQSHVGIVKAKLARLKDKEEQRRSSGRKGEGYNVRRSGDATVVLLGYPSVGKSTLLNALTNAKSPTASYAFTTVSVIPGMMNYEHAKIQILDVPGILKGASAGTGRGKEVLSVIRGADMVLMVVEASHPEHLETLKSELYDTNVRVNKYKPDVRIKKTVKNGIRIGKTVILEDLSDDTIRSVLKEFRISNADVLIRSNIDVDELIDVIEDNKVYMPCVVALSKADVVSAQQAESLRQSISADCAVSAEKGTGIAELKQAIFSKLNLIRVYLKEPGKDADLQEPLIVKRGITIGGVCEKLHKDFANKFRFARVWGSSKFPGQKLLSKEHVLKDKDVLEIHLR